MGTLQRLFWRSTFNPLIVFVAILLAFFAFRASAAERVVLIALGVVLLIAQVWRIVVRHKRGTDSEIDASPAELL